MMSAPQLKSQTLGTVSKALFITVVAAVVVYYHCYNHFLCDYLIFVGVYWVLMPVNLF